MGLADMLRHARNKWLLTIGDHRNVRKLYHEFSMERVKKHLSVPKIICDSQFGSVRP
jgi:hypothetical protein